MIDLRIALCISTMSSYCAQAMQESARLTLLAETLKTLNAQITPLNSHEALLAAIKNKPALKKTTGPVKKAPTPEPSLFAEIKKGVPLRPVLQEPEPIPQKRVAPPATIADSIDQALEENLYISTIPQPVLNVIQETIEAIKKLLYDYKKLNFMTYASWYNGRILPTLKQINELKAALLPFNEQKKPAYLQALKDFKGDAQVFVEKINKATLPIAAPTNQTDADADWD